MQQEYLDKINAKIKEMDAEIIKLQRTAKEKGAEAEKELNKLLEKYQVDRKDLQDRLNKMQKTGKEVAKDVAEGMDKALEEMKKAFAKARSRFQ